MNPRLLLSFALPFVLHALHEQQSAYPPRAVEPVIEIGKGRNDVYAGMTDMAVSADGKMYILEGRQCTVKVIDQTGKQVKAFGGVGSGKGQCAVPGAIDIVDSVVIVTDSPRNGAPTRRVKFDLNGKALDVETISSAEMASRPKFTRGGTKLFSRSAGGGVTVYAVRENGQADSLFRFMFDGATIKRGETVARGPSGFGISGAWAIHGDSVVAFADGFTGIIKWFLVGPDGAKVVRTAEMKLKPDTVTPDDLVAQAERMGRLSRPMPGGQPTPSGPMTITDAQPYWSLASTAFFASDGSLWVGNPRRSMYTTRVYGELLNGRAVYTVFPPTGEPYSVNLPVAFTPYAIIGDIVYGWSTNAMMGTLNIFRLK